jgi:hypothetical protein
MPPQPRDDGETSMSKGNCVSSIVLVAALSFTTIGLDCDHHHREHRIYDPYYTDYHVWNDDETANYRQWSSETHRDPNRDFRKLPPQEQKEYWTWRHNHGDRESTR